MRLLSEEIKNPKSVVKISEVQFYSTLVVRLCSWSCFSNNKVENENVHEKREIAAATACQARKK